MNLKRLVSIATVFIFTATLMRADYTSSKENSPVERFSGSWSVVASTSPFASDGTIRDQGISSEVVLTHELNQIHLR